MVSINERATASGIATMAGYIGMVIGLAVTPVLASRYGLSSLLMIYGYVGILSSGLFLILAKAKPPTPPCAPEDEVDYPFTLKGLKKLLVQKDFIFLLVCVFIVMGIFNAVMTWIENILSPRGLTSAQAGLVGGVLVIVGLIGAVVLPVISDGLRTRKKMLFWSLLGATPGFIGLTFISGYIGVLISAGIMGFFLMGVGPIAFQYGAEIAYPIPEGTSFGILMLMGQISGIIFTYVMDIMRSQETGSMMVSMILLAMLMLVSILLTFGLKESPLLLREEKDGKDKVSA